MTATPQLTARNASAQDLVRILNEQQAAKLDVVAPAAKFRSRHGLIQVSSTVADITEDGVTSGAGFYQPTQIFDDGVAAKLGIGTTYMRKMREAGRTDLIDGNVNGWLHGQKHSDSSVIHDPDERSFLLRLFRGDATEDNPGVARALLSDKYALSMDNLDILTAVNKGIQEAGVSPVVRASDLSESRMRVRFEFPDRSTTDAEFLEGYRSPFAGGRIERAGHRTELQQRYGDHHIFREGDQPILYMGFDLANCETGGGAYTLTPVVMVLVCTNGLVQNKSGMRKVHLGRKLEEGRITPSLETLKRAGALVASETTDAVTSWLKEGYLEELVAGMKETAATPVERASEVVPAVCQRLGFTQDEQKDVLDFFIASGQPTAGGVAQAISAYAQTVQDPDRAYEIEQQAVPAMELAAG
jgi:hypothetical protein